MPSLKEFRNRIDSVKSTQKITKAKQMVAAAKLRKAQDAAEAARPYAQRIAAVVANLSASMADNPGAPKLLVGSGKDDVQLLIVATADRGLCGAFNTNIVRKAREEIVKLERDGKTVKILCVGRKGYDQLKVLYKDRIIDVISFKELRQITSHEASEIAERVRAMFEDGEVDVVKLVYSEFKNVISQVPTVQTLLPAAASIDPEVKGPDLKGAAYEYEPDEEEILAALLPRNLTSQVFNALLQNVAGEQGASMTAMDNATRNAGDMINKLTLEYNRKRQANITKELIEIISGAEAV